MGKCKLRDEREFYLRISSREKWSTRELDRQINSALFERTAISLPIVSAALTQLHPTAETLLRDSYLLDFLELPAQHSEDDLQKALVANLKQFLLELGRDFAFVGENYLLQVGGKDFRLDLLFYHREL